MADVGPASSAHPLVDLGEAEELDLSVLDEGTRAGLVDFVRVQRDTADSMEYGTYHLAECAEVDRAGRFETVPLANLYYHLCECCEDLRPSQGEHTDTLARLVLATREPEALHQAFIKDLGRSCDALTGVAEYAPLREQVESAVADLLSRNEEWVRVFGPEALLEEAAFRSIGVPSSKPAPRSMEEHIAEVIKGLSENPVEPTDADEPDAEAFESACEGLRAQDGLLLVHLPEDDAIFQGRLRAVLLPFFKTMLNDALQEHLINSSTALLPARYRPLAEVAHGDYYTDLVIIDVTNENPAAVETACTLLGDGEQSAHRALELARELA